MTATPSRYRRRADAPAATAAAVLVAVALDRAVGEPPDRYHPVARYGGAMQRLEQAMWADRRAAGAAYAGTGVALAALAGRILAGTGPAGAHRSGPARWRRRAALVAAVYTAIAGRALEEAAMAVDEALRGGDLAQARHRLRSLVGRRTEALDETEVVRAVVESVAENTVDAVTAPLLWAVTGGASAVLVHRAANTLDAMVGHRSDRYLRFGWASARLDDLLNWVPARVTAVAVAATRPRRAAAVYRAVTAQAPAHPSPNAGVAEAAFAAALGVRLGGTNDYSGRVERRPVLGDGRPPVRADIAAACRLSRHVTLATLAIAVVADATARTGGRR